VLVEPPAANLNGVYAQIEQIAQATGHSAAAAKVVASMKRQIAAIVASVPRPKTPLTVYHELDQNYYSANSHTFIGRMYKLLGLVNIADKAHASSDYPQLSAEYIVASNPDLIVLAEQHRGRQGRRGRARERLDRLGVGTADRPLPESSRGRRQDTPRTPEVTLTANSGG
jgi:ABC-type Fe3+-hydroxamate transport system substrate-binding protein